MNKKKECCMTGMKKLYNPNTNDMHDTSTNITNTQSSLVSFTGKLFADSLLLFRLVPLMQRWGCLEGGKLTFQHEIELKILRYKIP